MILSAGHKLQWRLIASGNARPSSGVDIYYYLTVVLSEP